VKYSITYNLARKDWPGWVKWCCKRVLHRCAG